jgi:hypothetical protein
MALICHFLRNSISKWLTSTVDRNRKQHLRRSPFSRRSTLLSPEKGQLRVPSLRGNAFHVQTALASDPWDGVTGLLISWVHFPREKKVDVNQSQQMTSQLLLFSIQYCREGVQVVITRLAVFDSQQSKYNQIPAGERSLSEKHLKSRKYNADSGFNFTCRPHLYFVLGSSSTASYSQKNLMKYRPQNPTRARAAFS